MAEPRRLLIIRDPKAPNGSPPGRRSSRWPNCAPKPLEIRECAIYDLLRESTVLRFEERELVVVNWDSANGDYSCHSNETLYYLQTQGPVRIKKLMQGKGIFWLELQSIGAVPVQAAYDAILGQGEVEVMSEVSLSDNKRLGRSIEVVPEYKMHPLVSGLPPQYTSPERTKSEWPQFEGLGSSPSEGEFTSTFDRNPGAIWSGWFTHWKRGWIPLFTAIPEGTCRQKARQVVLLAKIDLNGLKVATTLRVAEGSFEALIRNAVQLEMDKVQEFHNDVRAKRDSQNRVITWLSIGFFLIALSTWYFNLREPASEKANVLAYVVDMALTITGASIVSLIFWGHDFLRKIYDRPYGLSFWSALGKAVHESAIG